MKHVNFSLQDSHPHWVLRMPETAEYTISQFMHKLNTRFGKWFNTTFHRKGSFWADRFSCTWVEPGSMHFFELTRYVDRNPLERQFNQIQPHEYRWGSFRSLFQAESPYPVTFLRYLYQAHPDKSAADAWQWYEALVAQADLDTQVRQQFFRQVRAWPFLGSERFRETGKALYQVSLKDLQVRGLSWIKLVRDYKPTVPAAGPSDTQLRRIQDKTDPVREIAAPPAFFSCHGDMVPAVITPAIVKEGISFGSRLIISVS